MAVYVIAAAIKNPSNGEFLVVRQTPPPPLPDEEYRNYVDSDLWDLPSASLRPLVGDPRSDSVVYGADSFSGKLNLRQFDVDSALDQIVSQVCTNSTSVTKWRFLKYIEEAEFGPGPLINTLFICGELVSNEGILQGSCQWLSKGSSLKLLREVEKSADRIGHLTFIGLLSDSTEPAKFKCIPNLSFQEYPPGIMLLPMKSRTIKPFSTTNLVVIAPDEPLNGLAESKHIASGDAMLVDPGCASEFHLELEGIAATLPRKLVVFVTHHHRDHVDGLSVIQKCNPDAVLLAHKNTSSRIGKGEWSLPRILISGGEVIYIGDQHFEVIFAPGHTDGHLALRHVSTNSLIVGDHCVGQGSAALDVQAGGNMTDYFETTYRFLDISPHVLIPMHGRINLWPKQMLCGYLKHRREREASILQAIENGAVTLFDIVKECYGDLDLRFWIPASSNVRLHVDHLAYQDKLPKVKFVSSTPKRLHSNLYFLQKRISMSSNKTYEELKSISEKHCLMHYNLACENIRCVILKTKISDVWKNFFSINKTKCMTPII